MRMWGSKPNRMCNKHILGEHLEMHMFAGSIKKKIDMMGYVANNLVDLHRIKERHDELAAEMTQRGMNHKSPMTERPDTSYLGTYLHLPLNIAQSEEELHNRCPDCSRINAEFIKRAQRNGSWNDLL
jgi:hypothetical protein